MKIFQTTPKINFLSYSKYMFWVSNITICIGVIFIIFKGLQGSIDFTGGTIVQVEIDSNEINLKQLREDAIQEFKSNINIVEATTNNSKKNIILTLEFLEDEESLNKILYKNFSNQYIIKQIESIGPKIGNELRQNARNAVLASLLLIGLYITIRFDSKYALGSIAALLHDIFIIISLFSVFSIEISIAIVAALLTIAGYSLNDTIVVYDRIRENIIVHPKKDKKFVINQSLNETLSRTIITSLTTLVVVIVLYFFGGEVLQPFSLALIIGIMVGTYSSLFVASPIMYMLEKKYNFKTTEEE